MENIKEIIVNNKTVRYDNEKNILEVIRKSGIDLPTFCYHSELSVYGACRMCMVEVEGRGLVSACSTAPENGLKVKTHTDEIRKMRKIIVELLLASHAEGCPTCPKGESCKLQDLARKLGIKKVRYKKVAKDLPIDNSSHSLTRDPNKCILCGDCVRMCYEVQGIGAIDFANRGSMSTVTPCFGKDLDKVECVYCGQCVRVCPTGALTPKSNIDDVWGLVNNKDFIVVAQVAPAVRVAIGEHFGMGPGKQATGQIVAALYAMGFDKVYDTSFTADLTVVEEGTEFIKRVTEGGQMPQLTSCCPAWVKFVEQYYPEFIGNLSTCRSPQQMFGALSKDILAFTLKVPKENIKVVSIMPCTAKKFEARRPEFNKDGYSDVDYVLTTQELARMIEESGLDFAELEPSSFELPFGFKTGAGIIFGSSGGVTEAVLRFVDEKISGERKESYEFPMARGQDGVKHIKYMAKGKELNIAIVNGLGNAKKLMDDIKAGRAHFDLIEVMACPGGCIGGAGQPVQCDIHTKAKRAKGLYDNDKMLELHKAQDNPYIKELYNTHLDGVGGHKAHKLLHTNYNVRKRTFDEGVKIFEGKGENKVEVDVCFGTGCFLKGAQKLLKDLLEKLGNQDMNDLCDVKASFCLEKCDKGPNVKVGGKAIEKATTEKVIDEIKRKVATK